VLDEYLQGKAVYLLERGEKKTLQKAGLRRYLTQKKMKAGKGRPLQGTGDGSHFRKGASTKKGKKTTGGPKARDEAGGRP